MKVKVLPFHAMYDINDNMYENVVIIAKKSKEIISKRYSALRASKRESKNRSYPNGTDC